MSMKESWTNFLDWLKGLRSLTGPTKKAASLDPLRAIVARSRPPIAPYPDRDSRWKLWAAAGVLLLASLGGVWYVTPWKDLGDGIAQAIWEEPTRPKTVSKNGKGKLLAAKSHVSSSDTQKATATGSVIPAVPQKDVPTPIPEERWMGDKEVLKEKARASTTAASSAAPQKAITQASSPPEAKSTAVATLAAKPASAVEAKPGPKPGVVVAAASAAVAEPASSAASQQTRKSVSVVEAKPDRKPKPAVAAPAAKKEEAPKRIAKAKVLQEPVSTTKKQIITVTETVICQRPDGTKVPGAIVNGRISCPTLEIRTPVVIHSTVTVVN